MIQNILKFFRAPAITLKDGREITPDELWNMLYQQPAMFAPVYDPEGHYSGDRLGFTIYVEDESKPDEPMQEVFVPRGAKIKISSYHTLRGPRTLRLRTDMDVEDLFDWALTKYMDPW